MGKNNFFNSLRKDKDTSSRFNYFLLFACVFIILSITIPEQFLSLVNLQSMGFQVSEFGILSLGMMIAMIIGGIDLSIVANANLAGIVATKVMLLIMNGNATTPIWLVLAIIFIVAILAGMLGGFFNGLLIAKFGIPPILMTLGSMKLFEGISTVLTNGQPLRGFPEQLQFIGNGTIGIIPFSIIIFLVCTILMNIFMRRTTSGFQIYMMGSNPTAARYSGLSISSLTLRTYTISGLMAGIASIIMMSRFNSVKVGYGNSYQLQAILVVILGGVSTDGGEGDVWSVLFSILTLQCIASGFNILGFSNYIRNVIYGCVLIVVLIVTAVALQIKVAKIVKEGCR